MTTTSTTQNPSLTTPAGTPNRRLRRGVLGAAVVLAGLGGAVALAELSGSDRAGAPTTGAVVSPAAVPAMSADAAERWAIAEAEATERLQAVGSADAVDRRAQAALSADVVSCRSGTVAPDAIERCLAGPVMGARGAAATDEVAAVQPCRPNEADLLRAAYAARQLEAQRPDLFEESSRARFEDLRLAAEWARRLELLAPELMC